jgi:anti-anti-sigma regulatory factor
MYGNPAFDCAGATIHAVCRQLATVVTIEGVVDDTNIERVTALALRFVIAEKPFVLDLSGVNSFSAHSVSLLSAVDESCFHSDVEWSLIASASVLGAVQASGASFPIADTVPDALHHFADSIEERRRLLPLLTKKTA